MLSSPVLPFALTALLFACSSAAPSNPEPTGTNSGGQSANPGAGAAGALGPSAGAGGQGPSGGAAASSGGSDGMPAAGSGGSAAHGNAGAGGTSAAAGAGSAGSAGRSSAGPPSCAASNYLICEDFESGVIPAGWNKQGDIQVATDDAYQSAHSLKVFVSAGKSENYRSISMNPSMLGTGHWGRVYYKVQAPPPAYFAHDTFVALTGDGPDAAFKNENVRVVDTVHNADGSHQFLYNVQPSGNEFGKGSPYPYTFNDGGWHCAEWHIDNPTQNYHFYYDGAEVTSIAINNGAGHNAGSEIPASFSQLTVGVAQYQSPPAGFSQEPQWFTAWLDDLALDTNRIGCN